MKKIEVGEEASKHILDGIDRVADIVKTTIGPKGRNVLIRELINAPLITNDGVTIAKAVELQDAVEDAGAQLLIQAANKTNDVAGDGTSTTSVLAQEIIHQFYRIMQKEENKNVNVVQVQNQMIQASNEISNYIKDNSVEVKSTSDIAKVATISAQNRRIGELIADANNEAGKYGSIIVEDSKTGKDTYSVIKGMKIPNGSVTPYLLNDKVNNISEVVDCDVLVTKDKIDSVTDMFAVLDKIVQANKKLLIICDDIEFEPLNMIIMNKAKGAAINVSIIQAPGFGQLREDLLEDVCIATGATLMGRDNDLPLKDFELEMLGELSEATITMNDTILKFKDTKSNGINLMKARTDRELQLENLYKNAKKEDKEQYERRMSNLLNGIVQLEVGGNSAVEIQDKKLRIEDALNSVEAAKEEGIVAGGGYSFIKAREILNKENMNIGEQIIYNSLPIVTKQIAENAGYNSEEVVETCIKEGKGFNAETGKYENLIETGVINSAKVDRYSLINATSVAAMVATMGGLIVDNNNK